MNNKKPKVFLGTTNIASVFDDLAKYFKQAGWDTYTVVESPNHAIISGQYDEILAESVMPKWIAKLVYLKPKKSFLLKLFLKLFSFYSTPLLKKRKKTVLEKAIVECDFFVFIWSSLHTNYEDYKKIKDANKKIAVIFCGDDARWYHGMRQEFASLGMDPVIYPDNYDKSTVGLKRRLARIMQAERYADFLYNKREQAQICLRPFHHYPMIADIELITEKNEQSKKCPIVVHAPSSASIKGTKYVLEVFDKLEREGIDFVPKLLQNVDHQEALKIYQDADIVIDQLFLPGAGRLATEALASGAVVLGFMDYENYFQAEYFKESPIVDVDKDSLYSTLKELILNYEKRVELAKKSRPYALKYLHSKVFVDDLIQKFNGEEIPLDYTPKFFREEFVPESADAIVEYNKYIDYVKNCEWYQNGIEPGERAGLRF